MASYPWENYVCTQQENILAGWSKSSSSKAAAEESTGGVASRLR